MHFGHSVIYSILTLSCLALWEVQGAETHHLHVRAVDTQTTESPSSTPETTSETPFSQTTRSIYQSDTTQASLNGNSKDMKKVKRFRVAKFDFPYVGTFLITSLFIAFVCAAKVVYHTKEILSKTFPESCMLIVCGAVLGIIMYFCNVRDYQLNAHLFFLVILPPIIFDAGYFMPVRAFFNNLGTILMYAVFGTLIYALMLGWTIYGISTTGVFQYDKPLPMLHILTHASILSAVDPVAVIGAFDAVQVNDWLYICVFGEALLNDGIAVVLYRIFNGYSAIGTENINSQDIGFGILSFFILVLCSPSLGIIFGFLAGFLSRFTHHFRQVEPFLVFTVGYVSFVAAEMLHLSGILSSIFCGITMRKYVDLNFHKKSTTTIKIILRTVAQICEGIIFLYLGVAAVNEDCEWNTLYSVLVTLFCVVFRFVACFGQTFFLNKLRHRKLDYIDQFILSYSGLRGAIAFALTYMLDEKIYPERNLYVTTTLMVVYFTNIFLGTTIEPIVSIFRVSRKDTTKPTMNTKIADRIFDHALGGIEAVISQRQYFGYHGFRMKFSEFNNNVLKPLIVGKKEEMPGTHRGHQLQKIYFRLSEQDARALIRTPSCATDINRYGALVRRVNSTTDLTRVDTETSLFSPRLWGLPSFTMEDRRGVVPMDHEENLTLQVNQAVASANTDKTKYAKHYTSRARNLGLASSASACFLDVADNKDLNISAEEQTVRYRNNNMTSPPEKVEKENAGKDTDKSDANGDNECPDDGSGIQFFVKSSPDDPKDPDVVDIFIYPDPETHF